MVIDNVWDNTTQDPYGLLLERLHELADIESAAALLNWDQETTMPAAGAPGRADALATLTRLVHERLTAPEVGEWLSRLGTEEPAELASPSDPEDRRAAIVRVTRRDRDKAARVPAQLVSELTRAGSIGQHAWIRARASNDFAAFLPHLRELITLRRRYGDCFPEAEHPYDPLLDDYDEGLHTAKVKHVFAELRDGLVPLVSAIAQKREAGLAPEPFVGPFLVDGQRALVRSVLADVGFDPQRFLLGQSSHPFSTQISLGDLRITARYDPATLECLFAGMHEFGHALYEAQVDPSLGRTPLCSGVSSSVHESQSRLWENMVGRGRPFAKFVLPKLRSALPSNFDGVDSEDLYRRLNVVHPSPIRVEADEVTYALHVILRFELEVELFEGKIEAEELPQLWRERMQSYLGVEVTDDARGVLQDIHWSFGAFGYFPTYALGNLIAAQLWSHICSEIPSIDESIEEGDFAPLREWLGERVHRFGRMLTPEQTLRRAISEDLAAQPYLDYLWAKHGDVHGVSRPAN